MWYVWSCPKIEIGCALSVCQPGMCKHYEDCTFFRVEGINMSFKYVEDKQWRSWLRHCATKRKVACSIPYVVTGIFQWLKTFRLHCGPGVDSVSDINEYQESFLGGKKGRCVGLTTLPYSCVDCLEILEPQSPGTPRACPGM
jgi:hypothetical protein